MSLKFLYIDESSAFHETIAKQLNELERVGSLHCFNSIKKAEKHLKEQEVDVIIIDPNFTKENGFSFIEKKIKNQFFILHSARIRDAVKGYELGIFDFFPKPFTIDRFSMTLKRLYQQEYVLEKQRSFLPRSYIEVRCDLMKERILHDNISHVEAMGDYVKIVTENRKYVVLMSMKKIEELLPEELFFRTHKSFIVNSKKIQNFTAKEVVLKKIKVPLSRFKKQAFIAHMLEI
jgi:two-component system, LytTR family, response regulator